MDSIINKLTEIESAASAIVQHAEAEKSALDEKFDKKRMDFDKELEADTQRQIQGIRDKLEAEHLTDLIPGKVRKVRMNSTPCRRNIMKSILIMLMRFSDGSLRCSLWEIYWNTVVS